MRYFETWVPVSLVRDQLLRGAGDGQDRGLPRAPERPGRGACRHPDGAVRFGLSGLSVFAAVVAVHRAGHRWDQSGQLGRSLTGGAVALFATQGEASHHRDSSRTIPRPRALPDRQPWAQRPPDKVLSVTHGCGHWSPTARTAGTIRGPRRRRRLGSNVRFLPSLAGGTWCPSFATRRLTWAFGWAIQDLNL